MSEFRYKNLIEFRRLIFNKKIRYLKLNISDLEQNLPVFEHSLGIYSLLV